MRIWDLKCWPEHFMPIIDREKTFDIRFEDGIIAESGGFQVGDIILFREYRMIGDLEGEYTDRVTIRVVSYVMRGGKQKGQMEDLLPHGRAILGLAFPPWELIQASKVPLKFVPSLSSV